MMPSSPTDLSQLWLCHPPCDEVTSTCFQFSEPVKLLPLRSFHMLVPLPEMLSSSLSMAGPTPSLNLILNFTSLTIFLKEGSLCFLQLKLMFLRIIGTGCCFIYLSLYFLHLL